LEHHHSTASPNRPHSHALGRLDGAGLAQLGLGEGAGEHGDGHAGALGGLDVVGRFAVPSERVLVVGVYKRAVDVDDRESVIVRRAGCDRSSSS
jgi:hypothetical protein